MKIKEIEIPGKLNKKEADLRKAFLNSVHLIPGGEKINACLQCGTCTGSCPLSYLMDITPRELIALFRAGDIDSIMKSRTIWVCASCYSCQSRCPSTIKVTEIIYSLKRMAMNRRVYPKNFPVHSLSDSFIKSMKSFGRLNEPRLMLYYLLKTGIWKGFSFIPLGVKMLRKGRIDIRAAKIKDRKGLRKIIDKAQEIDFPLELAAKSYREGAVGYKAVG
ncbi:MAG: 4Fe-4S dicluster domain-containing protein [Melioribacteraceae bacterium]|nr:4Fe-4S dicluster domain-containing protein [Melioribacteraceae bacterium]